VTIVYAALALVAFAANSVLCRLALHEAALDPATFTSVRVISGAAALLLVMACTGGIRLKLDSATSPGGGAAGAFVSPAILFIYAIPFSFAYTQLSAGAGALILFGSVQVTMLGAAAWSGETLRPGQALGVVIALAGLVTLVLPGLTAPPPIAAGLMGIAGIFWGLYTLRGRGMADPLVHTTMNFVLTVPLVLLVSALMLPRMRVSTRGLVLAIVCGALTSGLGYVAWYSAVRRLTATRASVLQLAVPVLAAAGGVAFLAEPVSLRLAAAAVLVIGGIALTLTRR
jgi:drug/metabolite transporter (DMT)-like permease